MNTIKIIGAKSEKQEKYARLLVDQVIIIIDSIVEYGKTDPDINAYMVDFLIDLRPYFNNSVINVSGVFINECKRIIDEIPQPINSSNILLIEYNFPIIAFKRIMKNITNGVILKSYVEFSKN